MTRIAILADVHGNVPALEAVLDDLAAQRVDEALVGGDLVGRGPEGSRVARRIRELGFPAIGGNHEDYLLGARRGETPDDWYEADEWAASRWMAAELDEEDVAYLAALPFSLARPGLLLVHGTPRSNREGIGPWTTDAELTAHLAAAGEPVVVCAHTHRPLDRQVAAGRVVNVGSVGLPFNGDRRAQYAVFSCDGDGDDWQVELWRVDYDLDRILTIYETSGFLAGGGITARLLRLELKHARALLVPFLKWTRDRGVVPTDGALACYLAELPPQSHRPG